MVDDDLVLDRVTAALLEKPRTFSELYASCTRLEEPAPRLHQVEEALDILIAADAIKEFKETRFGDRMRIFTIKSEARTYWTCKYCKGTGYEPDQQRGLCKFCRGNGVFTPRPGDDGLVYMGGQQPATPPS